MTTLLKLQPSTAPTVRAPSLTQAQSAALVLALLQAPCQVSSRCWLQKLVEHLPAWLSAGACYYQPGTGTSYILADQPACIPATPQNTAGSRLTSGLEPAHEEPSPSGTAYAACFTALLKKSHLHAQRLLCKHRGALQWTVASCKLWSPHLGPLSNLLLLGTKGPGVAVHQCTCLTL